METAPMLMTMDGIAVGVGDWVQIFEKYQSGTEVPVLRGARVRILGWTSTMREGFWLQVEEPIGAEHNLEMTRLTTWLLLRKCEPPTPKEELCTFAGCTRSRSQYKAHYLYNKGLCHTHQSVLEKHRYFQKGMSLLGSSVATLEAAIEQVSTIPEVGSDLEKQIYRLLEDIAQVRKDAKRQWAKVRANLDCEASRKEDGES